MLDIYETIVWNQYHTVYTNRKRAGPIAIKLHVRTYTAIATLYII